MRGDMLKVGYGKKYEDNYDRIFAKKEEKDSCENCKFDGVNIPCDHCVMGGGTAYLHERKDEE